MAQNIHTNADLIPYYNGFLQGIPIRLDHSYGRGPLLARGTFPMACRGGFHPDIYIDMYHEYPMNNRRWRLECMQPVLHDFWMQQKQMRGRFHTRVIITALFTLHKRMMFWSHPWIRNTPGEYAVWEDFVVLFNPRLWRELAFAPQEGENPLLTDRRFVDELCEYLDRTQIEGSTTKWHVWFVGVQPKNSIPWRCGTVTDNIRPAIRYVPSAELFPVRTSVLLLPHGPWNIILVCPRPRLIPAPEHMMVPPGHTEEAPAAEQPDAPEEAPAPE